MKTKLRPVLAALIALIALAAFPAMIAHAGDLEDCSNSPPDRMVAACGTIIDMAGKTVVVTKGTTNDQAMHLADKKFPLGLKFLVGDDHEQSHQMLVDGKADAFATDDILPDGLIAVHKSQDKFQVVGDYLSYDPYAIMFRKGEPQLTAVVERTMRKLATNQNLVPLYNKWFLARLPTGERLNVPMSAQLEDAFRVLDDSTTGSR
jgi:glutamate/aspartate transport system substrate-binding protein